MKAIPTLARDAWSAAQLKMAESGIIAPSWAGIGAERRLELIAALRASRDDFDALVIRYFIYPNL